jgi:hypothetical protein
MRAIVKKSLVVFVPESDAERAELDGLGARCDGHLFRLAHAGEGLQFFHVGPEDAVRARPINITSRAPAPLNLIANFAHTPFTLDGRDYASVEGFWQSLKVAGPAERARIAGLHGGQAKRAAADIEAPDVFDYDGTAVRAGTWDHWQLMRRACIAKFTQSEGARAALLSTGDRPLTHKVKRDSHTIPGVVMADIWMAVRARLRAPSS